MLSMFSSAFFPEQAIGFSQEPFGRDSNFLGDAFVFGTPFAYKAISVSCKATFKDQTNRWFFSKPMSKSTSQTGYGLRPTCLSFIEVLSQSVANISPTLTPVVIIPLVFASAGNGTWLAYLIATIGLMLVGLSVNQFAKRSASPGALFTYIGQG